MLHDKLDGSPATETGAGGEGIGHVGVETVFLAIQYGGHAALGVQTGAFGERRLAQNRDAGMIRHSQR